MRATVILGPTLPTQTLSPAGNGGGGGQGSGEGSAKGAGALQNRHLSLGASVPHNCPCPEPGPTWDVFRSPCWHRPGSLACPGEPASYFPPLARPVLLCPGSGLSRAAREPSGGGPPRFILRLALRAASWPEPPSGEARGSERRAGGWAHTGPREHPRHFGFQSRASEGSPVPGEDRAEQQWAVYCWHVHSPTHPATPSSTSASQASAPGPEEVPVATLLQEPPVPGEDRATPPLKEAEETASQRSCS